VQAHEPVPPGDPLLSAPNLILTPHCAGHSEESWAEMKRLACEAACRVLSGHWPRWVVNPGVTPRVPLDVTRAVPELDFVHLRLT